MLEQVSYMCLIDVWSLFTLYHKCLTHAFVLPNMQYMFKKCPCLALTIYLIVYFSSLIQFSCVDRKSSDLGLGGMRREYLQTDCAINVVCISFFTHLPLQYRTCFIVVKMNTKHWHSVISICHVGKFWGSSC